MLGLHFYCSVTLRLAVHSMPFYFKQAALELSMFSRVTDFLMILATYTFFQGCPTGTSGYYPMYSQTSPRPGECFCVVDKGTAIGSPLDCKHMSSEEAII